MRISYEKFILNDGHYKKVKDFYDKESKTIEVESNFVEFDFNFNGKVDHIKLFTSNDNLDTYHLVIDDEKFGLIFLESLEIEDKESIGYESKKIRNHYKELMDSLKINSDIFCKMIRKNFSNKERLNKMMEMRPEMFINLNRYSK